MNDRDLDYLESQNDDEISGLSAKVNILKNVRLFGKYVFCIISNIMFDKQITGKIGEEIRSGNSFIDQMVSKQ